ncbi:uncharacterized protein Bfra_008446 [Botrytis fragariae]|uniref:Uncharacterized protein n=1 Tax=Botrytis fragariae TaxID=1964551 RepID=A0A8H6EI74_9HELO|nr:uncharacterized protein Bfra_008446 [Botrytis fragariae]KAF5873168.1 hypothetical protein Bfra_008446 [Botrytis fragariae]
MIAGQVEAGKTEVVKVEVEFVVEGAVVEEMAVESWGEVIAGGEDGEDYVVGVEVEILLLSEELRARELNLG